MGTKIKASFKWAVLCVGMVFSGSVFSTVIEIDTVGVDKNDVTSTVGYDTTNTTNFDYVLSFDTDDIYNDGSDVAFESGSSIAVSFLYGLWASGEDQVDSADISILLNGTSVGSVSSNDGYYKPGYVSAIIDLDSTLFIGSGGLGDQTLTFYNNTPSVVAAIGRVELNYTPVVSPPQGGGSNAVPAPAPLALMALGMLGFLTTRKSNKTAV